MPIATNSEKIDISSEVKTAELAKNFSNILEKGDVIYLYGEIGVGKTTFIKHLINSLQKKKLVVYQRPAKKRKKKQNRVDNHNCIGIYIWCRLVTRTLEFVTPTTAS